MPNAHEMSIKPVRATRITDTTGALLGASHVRRRPRNTVKTDVFEHFLNILRKIHINLSTGFGRRSGGGIPAVQQKGRRQGRRAYITFGYQPKASGKDTGPWPAPGRRKPHKAGRRPIWVWVCAGLGPVSLSLSLCLSPSLSLSHTCLSL